MCFAASCLVLSVSLAGALIVLVSPSLFFVTVSLAGDLIVLVSPFFVTVSLAGALIVLVSTVDCRSHFAAEVRNLKEVVSCRQAMVHLADLRPCADEIALPQLCNRLRSLTILLSLRFALSVL